MPDSAETVPRVSTGSIVEDLATAAREIAIGHRYEVVTAFVGPGSMDEVSGFVPRHYDTRNGGNEMVLDPDMQGPKASKLVYHEYVHTRQRNLSPRWVAEGQAEFLAAELLIQSGRAPPRYVDAIQTQQLLNQTSGTVRTDGRREPYARGYYFFLNMDNRLAETNTSTEIVMRQVNSRQHTPPRAGTKQAWAHAVQTVSGERIQLAHPYEGVQSGTYWITTPPANPTLRLALGMLGIPIFRPIALLAVVGWLYLGMWDRASLWENGL
jgi:hypothetical protein